MQRVSASIVYEPPAFENTARIFMVSAQMEHKPESQNCLGLDIANIFVGARWYKQIQI